MKLYPARLEGRVTAPDSKSRLHRELIAQALCGEYPVIEDPAADIAATQAALGALRRGEALIPCGESGSTLRFLLPVAAAMGRLGCTLTGAPRLLERPVPPGLPAVRTARGWQITAPLAGGLHRVDGSQTSQTVSGLLLALPLCGEAAAVEVSSGVSAGYIALTCAVLRRYGIAVEHRGDTYLIPAGQRYRPAPLEREGDWSAAAWYLAANALGAAVTVEGLSPDSAQPDRAIADYCRRLPRCIDISATPDLFPVLALLAALRPGQTTRFTHCGPLRFKETDRFSTVAALLEQLGVEVRTAGEELELQGRARLRGGAVLDPRGDHRMAFLAAFGALFCDAPLTLTDAACVRKSYPRFWADYAALGGRAEE